MTWIDKINSSLYKTAWYIYLLPVFFILFNLREIDYCASAHELLLPVGGLLAASLLIFYFFEFVFKSPVKSGILTLLLLSFILFYSDIYFLINTPSKIILQNRYVLLIFFIAIACVGTALFILKKSWSRLNHYLNVLVLLLCLYEVAAFISYAIQKDKWSCYIAAEDKLHHKPAAIISINPYPDIYLIIVDSYTSAGSLKKYLGYDNSAFIDSMKSLGFYTAANSTSNYAYTPLSLASLLHADYLLDFNSKIENPILKDIIAMAMINNSFVVRELSRYGYESKNLSLFRLNGEEKFYTYDFLALPDYTLFSNKLFCKTIFFWYRINGKIMYRPHVINDLVDSTIAISKEVRDYPAFVYTHFPIPHGPFYFNKEGSLTGNAPEDHKTAYVEQLQYTNKLIYKMVKEIQDNSDKKSIILILGDHGSRFFSSDPKTASENYSTLSSFYFPKENYSSLYDSISHVNIFRAIFNDYFDEKLPRLEDRQDFWKPLDCR